MLSNWIKECRVHTASLTIAGTCLGYIIATGNLFDPKIILFGVFAFFFHAFGFLDNNVCDYKYDKKDPAKKHFKLVSGKISIGMAKSVILYGIFLTMLFGVYLSNLNILSMFFLFLAVISGFIYNRVSKYTILSPIPIIVSFTSLPLFAYFSVATPVSWVIFLFSLYAIFLMAYQIGYSGYYKDQKDPVNILRDTFSVKFGKKFKPTTKSRIYAWSLKTPQLIIGMLLIYLLNGGLVNHFYIFFLYIVTVGFIVYYVDKQSSEHYYNMMEARKTCAIVEIFGYIALIFALSGILGAVGVSIFILFPILWFVIFNKLFWGTALTPRV